MTLWFSNKSVFVVVLFGGRIPQGMRHPLPKSYMTCSIMDLLDRKVFTLIGPI
jgi:hypothetical protein